jgi:curved DNA-binding protein CbpA
MSAWAILGLTPGADRTALKRAYRMRALETHPDRGGDEARFVEVQRAYERLLARLDAPKRR